MSLDAYLPEDRLRALMHNAPLPDRTSGSALFADISGFTSLTESLLKALGSRRGAEELTKQLNTLYSALIAEVEKYGGSVIGFAGDAITCWFDGTASVPMTISTALGMQAAMQSFLRLALKISIATGSARRFVVGDPSIQLLDVLAGATVARTAVGEHLANKGDVLIDEATAKALGNNLNISAWHTDKETNERFAVVSEYSGDVVESQTKSVPTLNQEALKNWMHHSVYEREMFGQSSFLTEFRPCVAMFISFAGIDFDSNEAESQLDAFVRQVQNIAEQYSGTLMDITIGDKGSYAYINFGALTTHEDNARRAVKTALELKSGSSLSLQIGITQGMMWVGAYGGPTRRTFGAIGDEVNVSARLMTAATVGEVLLSGHVHKAVATQFIFEPRPPLVMKGKAEPLPVFALTGERQERAIRLQEPTYTLPMVGRKSELRVIEEKLDLALRHQSQIIGVVADAGLGKSRLVAEIIRSARKKGFVGYGGACQSDGIHTPYLVWKAVWSAFFFINPELPFRKQIRLLEDEIKDRVPQRTEALPLLGTLLGLNIPDNEFTQTLEPKSRQSALHILLEDCLKAAAKDEPLLIVIEDFHWIDALSYELLEELAKGLWRFPVCFVLAYRPPQLDHLQASRLEDLPQFTRIELSELSTVEAEQAIHAKLAQLYPGRSSSVPPALVEKLMRRAQGNPFYLEELLNYLHDRGLDPRDPADLEKIELPDSLYTLILSRIDQLTEREKTTLRVASIVGRLFRAKWLTGYYPELGQPMQVKATLDELDSLDITPLESPEPELAYLFKHIVTHEVTYESLPFATRARLHERLARYFEVANPDAPPLDTLAFHYGRSDNADKQREYFRRAGETAQKNYANDIALAYYGQLLSLLSDAGEKIEIHMKRGAVLELMGIWDEAEADYRAALEIAQRRQEAAMTASAQFALGKLCQLRGDFAVSLEWLTQARTRFTELDDPARLAQVLTEMGRVFSRKGEYAPALKNLNEGLALARDTGDKAGIALTLNHLGLMTLGQGDTAVGRAFLEESLALEREMGDKLGIAKTLNNLGEIAVLQADYDEARTLLEESLALEREMGDKLGIAFSLNSLAGVAYTQGDFTAAQSLYEESLSMRREMGDKRGISDSLLNLGAVAFGCGDHIGARTRFEESLTLKREVDDKGGIAASLLNLGCMAWSQGDYDAARALLEESLAMYRDMNNKWAIVNSLNSLGSVALGQDNTAAAKALFEESLALCVELGDKLSIASNQAGLAEVALALGWMERAVMLAAAAESLLTNINVTLDPFEHDRLDKTIATARATLGDAAFESAWEAGGKLSLEAAVKLAMNE